MGGGFWNKVLSKTPQFFFILKRPYETSMNVTSKAKHHKIGRTLKKDTIYGRAYKI
jgi:hypothetical protein